MAQGEASEGEKKAEKAAAKKNEASMHVAEDGTLYEQVYSPDTDELGMNPTRKKSSVFAFLRVFPEGSVSRENVPEIEGVHPIDDPILEKGGVLLPIWPEDYGSEAALIAEIRAHIEKYLDVGPEYVEYAAYYVLLTWLADKLRTVPYLRVLGDTGSGKSRFLDVIGRLCYKPIIIAGTATPAPIYRLMERWRGTLIIDEADRKMSDTADEIVKILNCGFERGKPVLRCDKERPEQVEVFDPFGPKVISTRYTFYDKALESRCITHRITETSRTDIPPVLPDSFFAAESMLRNKLLMFRLRNYSKVDTSILEDVGKLGMDGLEPRLKQTATPFLILFGNEGLRARFIDFLRKYNRELIMERAESPEGQIIQAIAEMREEGRRDISAKDIEEHITGGKPGEKEFEARKIGRKMKSLGFDTKNTKTDDGRVRRTIVFEETLWAKLKKRYVPAEIGSIKSVSSISSVYPLEREILKDYCNQTPLTDTATNATNATNATTRVMPLLRANLGLGRSIDLAGVYNSADAACIPRETVEKVVSDLLHEGHIEDLGAHGLRLKECA